MEKKEATFNYSQCIFSCHEWRYRKETWLREAQKSGYNKKKCIKENYAAVNYDKDDNDEDDDVSESQNAWFDFKNIKLK